MSTLDTAVTTAARRDSARTAGTSAFFGSTLEYFDFGVFGVAAALFFGPVFFPGSDPVTGTLLGLATYGAAYVTRPLGALFWGHLGDRVGRTRILLCTLYSMGAATFLVGCLPGYAQVGVAAPILLVVLRLVQGLSAGGESTGSSSVAVEHAPDDRRGFFGSLTTSGLSAGYVLSTAVSLVAAAMPREQALAWGWRIPFLASALVFVVTWVIRRRLAEPEAFVQVKREGREATVPLVEAVRSHRGAMVRVFLASLSTAVQTLFMAYSLSFAADVVKIDKAPMLATVACVLVGAVVLTPVCGMLSDRIGRKPMFVGGAIGSAVGLVAFFASVAAASWPLIVVTAVLLMAVFQPMMNGGAYAYYLEQFPARVRVSGMGVAMMLGLVVSGFAPAVAAAVIGGDAGNWPVAAGIFAVVTLVSGVAVATGPETSRTPTAALDR